ncbi:MAG: indole-3-glycerol phosphate synthase TrpC [Proteobacteria bacterium]|nr:indole-3-glycerol phosphate synthase TrpC [Pseudomonadota bacterium]
MSDALARICADKRRLVGERKAARPLGVLEADARSAAAPRGFAAALTRAAERDGLALIAEIKRASPSRGLIRADFDPATLARAYQAGGATCLSVLTDTPHFQGDDAHLVAARAACDLPCLRKDFMIDPYQVAEARAIGADCILIIMAALDDGVAAEIEAAALGWGMDVLVEVHDEAELERAARLRSRLIGINNRNLKTLDIDLAATERLAPLAPAGAVLVCESGLETHADLIRMTAVGAYRFLVGESLMREADVAAATAALLGRDAPARASA